MQVAITNPTASASAHHVAAMFLAIFLTAVAQLLFKLGATRRPTWIKSLVDTATLLGYGLFLVVTVLSTYAMQAVEMKVVTVWTGLTYVVVTIGACTLLGEKLSRLKVVGLVAILMGIYVFHR